MNTIETADAPTEPSDLERRADKSSVVAILLGLTLSPLAYYYVGNTKLAIINLLTLNYLTLGFIAVPIHAYKMIRDAEVEVVESEMGHQ